MSIYFNPEDYPLDQGPRLARVVRKGPEGVVLDGTCAGQAQFIELDWNAVHALVEDLNRAAYEHQLKLKRELARQIHSG